MSEYCSCGALLPPDAVFCQKCGKPQREIAPAESPVEEEVPVAPPPAPYVPIQSLPVSFSNPIAIRVALLVAVSATVLSFVLPFFNWIAGGYFAVVLYRRRTGSFLSVRAGLRLGWLTGILAFVLSAIAFTIQVLPHLSTMLQERMKDLPGQDPALIQEMTRFFQTGPGIATALVFSLAGMFVMILALTLAGSALGAKLAGQGKLS